MTARLISNTVLWREHCNQGRRNIVCNWLLANGLDPLAVLSTHNVTVEDAPDDGRQIRCMVIDKDATVPEERTVRLVVPPPADWPVYAAPGTSQEQL